jgi:hypothetical protein
MVCTFPSFRRFHLYQPFTSNEIEGTMLRRIIDVRSEAGRVKTPWFIGWILRSMPGFMIACLALPSAHATPIDTKYIALGGATGFLGHPMAPEGVAADQIGRYRTYQHGVIYWSPNTGAHEVHGAIRERWAQLHGVEGSLGYPTSDERPLDDGSRVSYFQRGRIKWTAQAGAKETLTPIHTPMVLGHNVPVSSATAAHILPPPTQPAPHGANPVAPVVVAPHPPTAGPAAGMTAAAPILPSRVRAFTQRAEPGSKIVKVTPSTGTTSDVDTSAGVQLRSGEFLVTSAKSDTLQVQGKTYVPLPIQALTRNDAGEIFELSPVVELGSAGLELGPDERYSGQLLVGVLDREKPNRSRPLEETMWVLLSSNEVNFGDPQINVSHTNLPFQVTSISGHPIGQNAQVRMQMAIGNTDLGIPVLRPTVQISGPAHVEGLGVGLTKFVVSLSPGAGDKARSVTIRPDKGWVDHHTVVASEAQSQELQYRSRWLGPDTVEATASGLASGRYPIQVDFPYAFLVASVLGGGLGAVILRLMRPNRAAAALTRYFAGGILMGFLVACIFALSVNVLPIPIPTENTPLAIFSIGALGAIAAIPLVSKWSDDFRGFLDSPPAQS